MLNQKPNAQKSLSGSLIGLSELVRKALNNSQEANQAWRTLRTTYQKKRYFSVWPREMIRIYPRSVGPEGSRNRDFRFLDNEASRCFIRNLWFLHQFFTRPKDVLRFLNSKSSMARVKQFAERAKQIGRLSTTYRCWTASAEATL